MRSNVLITDIDPIAYSDLQPPILCMECRKLRDSFVAHNYIYNGVQLHVMTCNDPSCIAEVCKQVADVISNGTFTVEHFQGLTF